MAPDLANFYVRELGMHAQEIISGGARLGLTVLYVGVMLCSIGPALLLSNVIARLIPRARKALDGESCGYAGADFRSSKNRLIKFH